MMDARGVLRFSVPGSLFVIVSLLAQASYRVAWGGQPGMALAGVGAAPAVVLLGASIPLGLVLYQMYYALYRPTRIRGRFATVDRGAEVLRHLTCEQRRHISAATMTALDARIATQPLAQVAPRGALDRVLCTWPLARFSALVLIDWREQPCPDGNLNCPCVPSRDAQPGDLHEAYKVRWNENWDVLMSVLELSTGEIAAAGMPKAYKAKSDMYHTLGAARTAIWLSALLTLAYNASINLGAMRAKPLASAVAVLVVSGCSLTLGLLLHQTRRQTQKSLLSQLKRTLRAVVPPDGSPGGFFQPATTVDLRDRQAARPSG